MTTEPQREQPNTHVPWDHPQVTKSSFRISHLPEHASQTSWTHDAHGIWSCDITKDSYDTKAVPVDHIAEHYEKVHGRKRRTVSPPASFDTFNTSLEQTANRKFHRTAKNESRPAIVQARREATGIERDHDPPD